MSGRRGREKRPRLLSLLFISNRGAHFVVLASNYLSLKTNILTF